jgi:hypothetical protein
MDTYTTYASVEWHDTDGWHHTRHLPTMMLPTDILGIIDSNHAERIAVRMISDIVPAGYTVNAHCYRTQGA